MSEEIKQEVVNTYDESQIQVLEGLEAVRLRPGMYIGSTGKNGLHHLVYEIVDNCIDEVVNANCDQIYVSINNDKSITVEDNGRGIPCGLHPKKGISTLEVILSTLHAGGKFGNDGYKKSGGLHGVGSSVVNALSVMFKATVHRDGNIYVQTYSKGIKTTEVEVIGNTEIHGTTIDFLPDDTIFNTIEFEYNILAKRLRELAFLNKKVTITLEDKREGKEQINSYHYEGGIKEFIKHLNDNKNCVQSEVCYIEREIDNCSIEIGFQYIDNYNENLFSFVNNINTIDGGYHVEGFYTGLVKSFNDFAKKNSYLKETEENFIKEDIKEGLTSVVSIKIENPEFEGQTKGKLGNTYVKPIINNLIKDFMEVYLYENLEISEQIIKKIKLAQETRLIAKKAKDLNRKKSKYNTSTVLPTKIAMCSSKNPEECEIYIVEGDSAGGSAKQARDRKTQSILPSKGKIMNVEKQKIEKVLASEEIKNFVIAMGTGQGEDYDDSKKRFFRVIIMSDADVDGEKCKSMSYLQNRSLYS